MNAVTVAYIFERYPVLTQSFLRRELAGLSQAGSRLEVHSMIRVSGNASEQCAREVPESIPVFQFRWWQAAKFPIAFAREWLRDPALLRDGWRLWRKHRFADLENFWATVWAVIFAFCTAREFRKRRPDVLHGVRATGPATAAAILSRLCGIPFTFGAHAYDIYRHGGDAFLEPKLRAARFVHTTTVAAEKHLRERAGSTEMKIVLARRGLTTLPKSVERKNASGRPVVLLSVGRLVPKKGHIHQITACALLKKRGIPFAAEIIGDGPMRESLRREIQRAGLGDCITLRLATCPELIEEAYHKADIFWHTGLVDAQGDRDGLPNVIPEAFANGLPVIASDVPGNLEAVQDSVNGFIVDPLNTLQVASAVQRLAEDPELRQRLGENGRKWVELHFRASRNAETLAEAFRNSVRPDARVLG